MVRYPAVAGQFYPASPDDLKMMLDSMCEPAPKVKAKAVVVPHAGYVYSGRVAGATYSRVEIPDINVLLGPNHTGLGKRVSVFPSGIWVTPFGEVTVDEEIAGSLCGRPPYEPDVNAHIYEHSLEVQLPFLQYCSGFSEKLKIVPVVFSFISYEECERAGEILADVLSAREDSLIVISSDFSHYVSQEKAQEMDRLAIDAILNLDPYELYTRVVTYNISMCGVVPATVGLVAARILGATAAELVMYRTSGDVTGNYREVVSYGGIIIY
ncbi:AmmeMemoRadiSam system protein B [Desulfurobacterium sp.]